MGCFAGRSKAEKARAVPARAGNGVCDHRKTGIRSVAPEESLGRDSDGVPLALVFAHENGASLETAVQIIVLFAASQSIQQLRSDPVKTTESFLLDSVGEHSADQVFRERFWWSGPEHHGPALTQRVDAEGPYTVDLGLNRSSVDHPLIHGVRPLEAQLLECWRLALVLWQQAPGKCARRRSFPIPG